MTPQEFIAKWRGRQARERADAQSHFNDLCALVGHPTPAQSDPQDFAFEYGTTKTTGRRGFADAFKRHHFGWEYKGAHADLQKAYAQLQRYAPALDNPPLLIVSDMERIVIHTNWTNMVTQRHEIALDDLADPQKLETLRRAFHEPQRLKPTKTRQELTQELANRFTQIAKSLRSRGHEPHAVAHFIIRLAFCMFAEDIDLLPRNLFTTLLARGKAEGPDWLAERLQSLFAIMRTGGSWGEHKIRFFNGGLFDDDAVLRLSEFEINDLHTIAKMEWQNIDPSIMGTLFERGLDPSKAHWGTNYTDAPMIMRIIDPVVVQPLRAEWAAAKKKGTRKAYEKFKADLANFRVLDPACGSGNFLYLALKALKDLEREVGTWGETTFGLPRAMPEIGPQNLHGIEVDPYAAELAATSVWIGDIQWCREAGLEPASPVLRKLKNIACHDALIGPDGGDAPWPRADAIVGNPPFVGGQRMLSEMGQDYVDRLRACFKGRVPGGADYVCYWFARAAEEMAKKGGPSHVGFVSTNSIRGGKNRAVLDAIAAKHHIFCAWPDEPWELPSAAVRVSLTCFARQAQPENRLNGDLVPAIASDLTERSAGFSATKVHRLPENMGTAFQGTAKVGPFDISGDLARRWLALPVNPNGRPNADVLRPWANGMDVTRRPSDTWIIDFNDRPLAEACLYEAPFEYVREHVKPKRELCRQEHRKRKWWIFGVNAYDLRKAISGLDRFIATSMVSKHRIFVWMPVIQIPENLCVVIARDDDFTFGVLSSRFHTLWALRLGTSLEDRPRYTPTTTFETFPFPPFAQSIADAAARLHALRENWLWPPGSWREVAECAPGYPLRRIVVDKPTARRTLTRLYNENPTWLRAAHADLDAAVAGAYGWDADIGDEAALARLFALNQARGGA
ncbi:MAG TPA: class I SAM-dependent DNA methyltransferase [Rhodospirillaceae bacterium]|nr:class I SAM-dependent DNA methyltransferase [Alphaproteobacteria bacterium]HBH26852.1 class I SAM-dependent DNA methyltransferase [Rhodospirillaceae bacterium]